MDFAANSKLDATHHGIHLFYVTYKSAILWFVSISINSNNLPRPCRQHSCRRASFLAFCLCGRPAIYTIYKPYRSCIYSMLIYNYTHIWWATRNVKNPPANSYGRPRETRISGTKPFCQTLESSELTQSTSGSIAMFCITRPGNEQQHIKCKYTCSVSPDSSAHIHHHARAVLTELTHHRNYIKLF